MEEELYTHMEYQKLWSETDSLRNGCEVKITQSCPTLCGPMDCIVRGILQD